MAEPNRYEFTYKEVAEALIKKQGITEGMWGVIYKFGIGATMGGPSPEAAVPTALVGVMAVGLERSEKETHHTVDASKVNPAKKAK